VTTPQFPPPGPAHDPLATGAGGPAPGASRPSHAPAPTPGTTGAPAARPTTPPPSRSTGKTIGRTLALALLLFVTVLLVLFVVYNTQTVDISLVFADVQAPLVLALVIAAGLGGLLVALAGAVMRARRRNR
jgi:uncharacterized integral membrane protein